MKFKRRKVKAVAEGSGEDILVTDVKALLKKNFTGEEMEEEKEVALSFKRFDEIEVDIVELSSLGRAALTKGADIQATGWES